MMRDSFKVCQKKCSTKFFALCISLALQQLLFSLLNTIKSYRIIYDRHIPLVKELIERPQYPAPRFKINPDIKNFYDFTVDDFLVEDYQAGPQIKGIPVAV